MYNFPVIIVVRRNVSIEKQPKMKNSIFIPVFNKVSAKKFFSISHTLSYFPDLYQNFSVRCFKSVTGFLLAY